MDWDGLGHECLRFYSRAARESRYFLTIPLRRHHAMSSDVAEVHLISNHVKQSRYTRKGGTIDFLLFPSRDFLRVNDGFHPTRDAEST